MHTHAGVCTYTLHLTSHQPSRFEAIASDVLRFKEKLGEALQCSHTTGCCRLPFGSRVHLHAAKTNYTARPVPERGHIVMQQINCELILLPM